MGILTTSHINSVEDFENLMSFCVRGGINKLSEVPIEETIVGKLSELTEIFKEEDTAEYIYDVKKLSAAKGKLYENLRYKINHFSKLYPGAEFTFSDTPPVEKVALEIKKLYEIWQDFTTQSSLDASHEEQALNRYIKLKTSEKPGLFNKALNFYLRFNGKLIGFAMVEIVKPSYAVGHFLKMNLNLSGSSEYFIHRISETLVSQNVKLLNAQEDMGVEGLRNFKQHLRPEKMAYAYTVVFG